MTISFSQEKGGTSLHISHWTGKTETFVSMEEIWNKSLEHGIPVDPPSLPTCLLTHLAVSAVINFVLNMGNEILVR